MKKKEKKIQKNINIEYSIGFLCFPFSFLCFPVCFLCVVSALSLPSLQYCMVGIMKKLVLMPRSPWNLNKIPTWKT